MIIDISSHNTIKDWDLVKQNCDGVIVRMGYTGYSSGKMVFDKRYIDYMDAIRARRIPYGLYYFPASITAQEAENEAEFIGIELIMHGAPELGMWLDSELAEPKGNGRADKLSRKDRTEFLHIIKERLALYGFECGIYGSTSWLNNQLDMSRLPGPVWVAQYNTQCTYKGSYNLWQYSSKGSIPGIVGNVDLSREVVDHVGDAGNADQELDAAIEVIARRVIAGKFGTGHDKRMKNIYALIKKKVNDII